MIDESATHDRRPTARPGNRCRKILTLLAVVLAFALVRIPALRVPPQSDDFLYVRAADAVLLGEVPQETTVSSQHAYRFGIVAPLALSRALVGKGLMAYYLLPTISALAGLICVFHFSWQRWGLRVAWPLLIVHLVLPHETRIASALLPNLPSAVCGMTAVMILARQRNRTPSRREDLIAGLAVGLLVFWIYMLRDKEFVLVLPALVLAGATTHRMRGLVIALGSLLVLMGCEQLAYASVGLPFGWRWAVLESAFREYWPFWERSSPHYFVVRPFLHSVSDFGMLGPMVTAGFFVAQVMAVLQRTDGTLRALALNGLLHFLVVGYYVFGFESGRFVAMNSSHRFYQAFYYSGLLSAGWLASKLLDRQPPLTAATLFGIRAALVAAMTAMACATYGVPDRLLASGALPQRLAAVIRATCAPRTRVEAWTPSPDMSALPLFRNIGDGRAITWLDELPVPFGTAESCRIVVIQWRLDNYRCGHHPDPEACRGVLERSREALSRVGGREVGEEVVLYGPWTATDPPAALSPWIYSEIGPDDARTLNSPDPANGSGPVRSPASLEAHAHP